VDLHTDSLCAGGTQNWNATWRNRSRAAWDVEGGGRGGGRAGGSRDDKSKGPPARRVASLSPSPLPADRSPPPLLSFSLFLVALSLTVRLPFTLSARCMQMFALALMARQRGRSRGNETTESVQRQRRRRCEGRDLFSRASARARFSVSSRGANRATKAARTDVLNRAQTNHFGTVARKHSCAMPRH